ncbi:MAG: class I SAM-dependent methyltransferase [Candidatus Thorarchaeota archaeon]|nr:class I SAM-dependent methyltransferase [Candidatus Thorarchaeota archaeon]
MDEFIKANREMWEDRVDVHKGSKFYDVEGFLKGRQTLDPIELKEVGDVAGKSLLHLQCHFGLDTLSWARLGAKVTGVDFSGKAIALAEKLAKQTRIDARFIVSDIYKLQEVLDEEFNIVFTSGGVLTWLPDISAWGEIAAHYVKKSGFFYIRDFHPFSFVFDDEREDDKLVLRYPYFHTGEPMVFKDNSTYVGESAKIPIRTSYEWPYSLSSVVNALIDSGLRIDFFNEFPVTTWKQLPFLVKREDGRWVLPSHQDSMPLMFSLKASKE